MNRYKVILISILAFSFPLIASAQSSDFMRSTGKMYVVVGVLLIIFIGIIITMINLDRRIKNIENQITNQ